ncbi:MAG: PEP-CTERM sorting domain-containing protein [Verrucomicrobiales bacterium]|jgi:hypothetical protein|nr:PEP-CTERM sorting domain-containing protein [Verrucomicrobiales bacterium]
MKTPILKTLTLILTLSVSALNVFADSDYTYWTNPGTGDWSEVSNWDNGVPTTESYPWNWAMITNGGTAVINSGQVNYNDLDVGANDNAGTLLITGNGSAYAYYTSIRPSGIAVVSDHGYWEVDSSGYLDVHGALTITDSGMVKSGDSDSTGSLLVNGSGYWRVATLGIGSGTISSLGTAGSLVITESGSVQSDYAAIGGSYYYQGIGTASVSGSGHWETDGLSVHNDSTLTITDNGSVHSRDGANFGAGTVSISGNGRLDIDGELSVGGGWNNLVTLSGTVRADQVTLHDSIKAGSGGVVYEAGSFYADSSYFYTGGQTLRAGARIELNGMDLIYTGEALLLEGAVDDLIFTEDFWVDFSQVTLADGQGYVIIDWTGLVAQNVQLDATFDAAGDVEGTFSVAGGQLVFNATAVPEPATWFLSGAGLGILLLTMRFRRRNVQS